LSSATSALTSVKKCASPSRADGEHNYSAPARMFAVMYTKKAIKLI
jgi:hypothetical protein